MLPGEYFGRGTHMSAVLKRDYARVRAVRGDRYRTRRVEETRMDGTGTVTTITVTAQPDAMPLSPRERHAMSVAPFHPGDLTVRSRG